MYTVLGDSILRAGEMAARQLYWRTPALRKFRKRIRPALRPKWTVSARELSGAIEQVVAGNNLVMCHVASAGIHFADTGPLSDPPIASRPFDTASRLLDILLQAVNATSTLVLPSYSVFQSRLTCDGQDPLYDPKRTPCWTGLVCELFWRRPDVRRSEFPIDSLSACGPLAECLFESELSGCRPAPHGENSAFARICNMNGIVMSIGVPLIEVCSIVHVAEDIHPSWPIKDFYRDRTFRVRTGRGELAVTVRERRPTFRRNYCEGQIHRDLLRAGVLRESAVNGVRVDSLRAGECLDLMAYKNRLTPYPYYWTALG